MLRIIARNIASNWIGYAVNAVVIFFLTPFVLHSLGDTRYGVWILVNGLTGYFGLLDLGLRGGTIQYLTRYLAQRDYHSVNRTASTSVAGLAACGLAVVLASAFISWLSPFIFTIPANAITEVRWCIALVGITTAAQFAFAPFSAVFAATQRYDLANLIEVPLRLATAAATYVALQLGYGLLGLCLVQATGDMLGCLLRSRIAHHILPQLHVSLRLAAWSDFRPIISYGVLNSLVQGASILKNYSGSLIIGLFMPLAALAPFNLAAGLVLQIDRLFVPVGMVFFPLATQLDAEDDHEGLRRIYFAASRIMLCGATAVAIIGAIWAADFYQLWVGSKFVDASEYTSVVVLFWILMAAGTIRIGQKIGYQVFLGCRAMRLLTMLTFTEALASLVLMIALIRDYGILGVVLATLIPVAIVEGFLFPIAVCRVIHARPVDYFRAAYVRPCLLAVILTGPLLFLRHMVPVHGSWIMLALCGILAGAVAAPLILLVGFDRQERRRIVLQPLRQLAIRCNGTQAADPQI